MWYNPLRLGMKEVARYTFRHGTFEISVGHPDRALLQDSERVIDLGTVNSQIDTETMD